MQSLLLWTGADELWNKLWSMFPILCLGIAHGGGEREDVPPTEKDA